MHSAPYFTALVLLAVFVSTRIVGYRRRNNVSLGDGDIVLLKHARTALANFAEYAPLGLVLLLALEMIQAPVWFLHLIGGTLLIGRLLHASAFLRDPISMNGRVAGMVLTYFSLVVGALGITIFSMLELHG